MQRVRALQEELLLKQSFFGLPWMVAGGLLPFVLHHDTATVSTWLWMVLAFLSARFSGMYWNRLIDHKIDAQNPRTCMRSLPRGALERSSVALFATFFLLLFFFSCYAINNVCLFLSPFVALLLFLYSFTKRFTALCHLVLGAIQALSPICAYAAITGTFSFAALYLGLAVGLSIAANDILYAMQDELFDRQQGLFSIPVRYGRTTAFTLAKFLHFCAFLCLMLLGIQNGFSLFYFLPVLLIGMVFITTYLDKKSTVLQLFTFSNTVVGFIVLAGITGEWLWRVL